MMQQVLITIFISIVYVVLSLQDVPQAYSRQAHSAASSASRQKMIRSRELTAQMTGAAPHGFETSTPPMATVARFDTQDNSWTFSARIIEVKAASIYSIHGRLARIEYLRDGKTQRAWAVLAVDDYRFTEDSFIPTVGQEIELRISGDFVSRYGVDLD